MLSNLLLDNMAVVGEHGCRGRGHRQSTIETIFPKGGTVMHSVQHTRNRSFPREAARSELTVAELQTQVGF